MERRTRAAGDDLALQCARGAQRVVVGAHNVHLQRCLSFDGTTLVGRLLAPVLGEDLVLIGTTRAAGVVPDRDLDAVPARRFATPAAELPPPPAHSLDAVMDAAGFAHHLVDLRRTPPDTFAAVTAMYGQHALLDLDPAQAFDAVVHVREISPAHGADDIPAGASPS